MTAQDLDELVGKVRMPWHYPLCRRPRWQALQALPQNILRSISSSCRNPYRQPLPDWITLWLPTLRKSQQGTKTTHRLRYWHRQGRQSNCGRLLRWKSFCRRQMFLLHPESCFKHATFQAGGVAQQKLKEAIVEVVTHAKHPHEIDAAQLQGTSADGAEALRDSAVLDLPSLLRVTPLLCRSSISMVHGSNTQREK